MRLEDNRLDRAGIIIEVPLSGAFIAEYMGVENNQCQFASESDASSGDSSRGAEEAHRSFNIDEWIEAGATPIVPPFKNVPTEDELADGRQKARKFFAAFLDQTWNIRKEGKKFRTVVSEQRCLEWMFPDVYDEVLGEFETAVNVEKHRAFRQFLETQLTPEELQRRRRGEW